MDKDAKRYVEAKDAGISNRANYEGKKDLEEIFNQVKEVYDRVDTISSPIETDTSKSNVAGALLKLQSDSFTEDNLKQLTTGELSLLQAAGNPGEIGKLESLLPDGQSIEEYYKGLLDITDE
jgi:hypothetical protein